MTQIEQAPGRSEGIGPYILAWLVACLILTAANWSEIVAFAFPDPDDTLRLIQVRDWLAGQSWFDLRQYRMNPPEGAPMHWSRLVDIPIALVILLLRPLVGTASAELAALVAVPLLTLAVVMTLVAKVTRRLLDREHAILAAFLVPVPMAVALQLRPMRIDHHGWQMALAMAALLAMLDPNRRRSGLVAGAAAATWLAISMEGLPFAVALVALAALRWLIDPEEGERLAATSGALAFTSLLLFALTKDMAGWSTTFCDALSPVHLAVLALGAVGSAAIVRAAPRPVAAKVAGLALLGAAGAGLMRWVAPQCAAGPFETLDPLVYNFWYLNVHEGLPVWSQQPQVAVIMLAFPLIGLFGTWRCFAGAEGERRRAWGTMLFMLVAAILTAIFVMRASAVVNLIAIPGGLALFRSAVRRAREVRSMPLRLAMTVASLTIIAPGQALAVGNRLAATKASASASASTEARPQRCIDRGDVEALRSLPAGDIAAPLDIGPSIIVLTDHRIIASGHHRNDKAMRDTIRIFLSEPTAARALMARRSIDYVVVCPGLPETDLYRMENARGLWAELDAGRTPLWLEPVRLPGVKRLLVWRVKESGGPTRDLP
jgi:hypothetical protein